MVHQYPGSIVSSIVWRKAEGQNKAFLNPPNGDSSHDHQSSKTWQIGSRAPGPRRRQHIQLQRHDASISRGYLYNRHSFVIAPVVYPHSLLSIIRYDQAWGDRSVVGGLFACSCFDDPGSASRGICCNCRVSLPLNPRSFVLIMSFTSPHELILDLQLCRRQCRLYHRWPNRLSRI